MTTAIVTSKESDRLHGRGRDGAGGRPVELDPLGDPRDGTNLMGVAIPRGMGTTRPSIPGEMVERTRLMMNYLLSRVGRPLAFSEVSRGCAGYLLWRERFRTSGVISSPTRTMEESCHKQGIGRAANGLDRVAGFFLPRLGEQLQQPVPINLRVQCQARTVPPLHARYQRSHGDLRARKGSGDGRWVAPRQVVQPRQPVTPLRHRVRSLDQGLRGSRPRNGGETRLIVGCATTSWPSILGSGTTSSKPPSGRQTTLSSPRSKVALRSSVGRTCPKASPSCQCPSITAAACAPPIRGSAPCSRRSSAALVRSGSFRTTVRSSASSASSRGRQVGRRGKGHIEWEFQDE